MSINKDSQKVPILRFKRFTDDWEQRRLGDIANRISKTSSSIELPKVEFEDIIAGEGRLNKDLSKKLDNRKGIEFQPFDVLYGKLRPYLKNWLFSDFIGIALGDFWVLRANDLTPSFLYTLIQSDNFQRVANDTSGTKMPRSDWKKVSSTKFYIPLNIKEQKKIGDLISRLDQTLTLHQRKLDQLEQLKQALLQQMFPGKGETVPKLRFAGFEGDWEELKLGEYTNYRRGSFPQPYGNKEWYGGENAMPFVQVVDVSNNLKLEPKTKQNISSIAQPKSVFVSSGTVVVTLQGSIGRVAITQYDSYVDRTLLIFEDYVRKTDKYFWGYTIQNKFNIEKEKAPGGTIKTITKAALSQFVVSIPLYGEQDKLGTFLKNIDTTIALQQRKLDQLQNMKQVLLQNMFI